MNTLQREAAGKPALWPWTAALSLPWDEVQAAYGDHVNPGFLRLLRQLGYDRVRVTGAEDVYYLDANGHRILDCWGGFGSLNLGHNHPRLLAARRQFDETGQVEICQAFLPSHAAVLARNLAAILPHGLEVSYFGCSGAEAVEGALKLAEKYHGDNRGVIVYARNAMHGKTYGALSVTGYLPYQSPFRRLPHCAAIPYGDSAALRRTLARYGRGKVTAVILEPLQSGGGVVVPPDGYLRQAAAACHEVGAVLIVDEVQTGFGRTGRMFACEYDGVVPDIVTLSKSLGGGKAPLAAYVAQRRVFEKAYGRPRDCLLHSSTFSGIGGSCALATEAIHILYDEGLVENAAEVGNYLLLRLRELGARYPQFIADVRGRGLLIGVEFRSPLEILQGKRARRRPSMGRIGRGALVALVANRLLFDFHVLVAFTEFDRNVMRLEPPLTLQREHADQVVTALDQVLSAGLVPLLASAARNRLLQGPGRS